MFDVISCWVNFLISGLYRGAVVGVCELYLLSVVVVTWVQVAAGGGGHTRYLEDPWLVALVFCPLIRKSDILQYISGNLAELGDAVSEG